MENIAAAGRNAITSALRSLRSVMTGSKMTNDDYLTLIDEASVYDVARETPLELAGNLSARLCNRIFMKREDLQPVFSFKLRGAYNKISSLPQ